MLALTVTTFVRLVLARTRVRGDCVGRLTGPLHGAGDTAVSAPAHSRGRVVRAGGFPIAKILLAGSLREHHIEHIATSLTVVVAECKLIRVVLEILARDVNVSAADTALKD